MALPRLIRYCGGVLAIAGVLLLALAFHPAITTEGILSAAWTPVHVIAGIGFLLALVGLVGVYLRLGRKAGILGSIGLGLTFLSLAVFVGTALLLEAFVVPILAGQNPALVDPAGPILTSSLGVVLLLVAVAFAIGAILLGISIIMSKVLPAYTGVLLILGSLIGFAPRLPLAVLIVSSLLLAAAFITIGYTIFKTSDSLVVSEVEPTLIEKIHRPAA